MTAQETNYDFLESTRQGKDTDPSAVRYQKDRIAHWDRVAQLAGKRFRIGGFYHRLLNHYYRFFIPPGLKVLELGCGRGDLLASLEPAYGVGVDFSEEMVRQAARRHPDLLFICADAHELYFKETFDVIILSDLVNDLWDVQRVLENLHPFVHPRTRIVINFYNNLWRTPLAIVRLLRLGADTLEQNWLSPQDGINLLELSGYEIINHHPAVLMPLNIFGLESFFNRFLAKLIPFCWFDLTNFIIARFSPRSERMQNVQQPAVSVVVPARNEAGNVDKIFQRVPLMGSKTEVVFIEGHSTDNTYEIIKTACYRYPGVNSKLFRQSGLGKGDAVRKGFDKAGGDILMILDADMTVPPEDLTRFYEALVSGRGEFINGVRLVYPLENRSMRFSNILGNKFFSLAFSWILGQPIKDTLCGTKVLWKDDYEMIARNRRYLGDFDPFGDFDLLFGAAKLNLKIKEIPIRYRARSYGDTNIDRWRHGWLLLKMAMFAARRIKFI